ncbi:MAG: DUF7742 family protein [Pararhodobacter sp.]
MSPVGLGDLAVAARALMAVPAHRRAKVMRAMIRQADRAHRYGQRTGRLHPRLGNGTLMSAALARPQARFSGPADADWLACLAEVVAAVMAWRAAGGRARRRPVTPGARAKSGGRCPPSPVSGDSPRSI